MLLSYWLRLICLVLFSVGIIQVTLHLLMQLVTPLAKRAIDRTTARFQERIYFAGPVATHGVALLLSLLVVVPQYIRGETNRLQERVGVVCVTGAVLVAVRYLYGLLRATKLLLKMHPRRHVDEPVVLVGDMAVHISADGYPLLAVAGLFSPRIVLSQHLLNNASFTPQFLEIALAHEKAHLHQYDNLKYFILASFALFGLGMEGSLKRWRHAAEHAADDDAVSGSSSRAILLAETLLVAARAVPLQRTTAFSLGLLPHEEELDRRIGRLLRDVPVLAPTVTPIWRHMMYAAAFFLASACTIVHLCAASLYEVAEYVLHIG